MSSYLVKAYTVDGASNVDNPGVDAIDLAGLQPVLCVQLPNSHRGRQGGGYDNCDEIKRLDCHVTRCNFSSDLWGQAGSLVTREVVNVVAGTPLRCTSEKITDSNMCSLL
jgi:hypothetical protein